MNRNVQILHIKGHTTQEIRVVVGKLFGICWRCSKPHRSCNTSMRTIQSLWQNALHVYALMDDTFSFKKGKHSLALKMAVGRLYTLNSSCFPRTEKKSGIKTKKHQQLKEVRLFCMSKLCENLNATPLRTKDRY